MESAAGLSGAVSCCCRFVAVLHVAHTSSCARYAFSVSSLCLRLALLLGGEEISRSLEGPLFYVAPVHHNVVALGKALCMSRRKALTAGIADTSSVGDISGSRILPKRLRRLAEYAGFVAVVLYVYFYFRRSFPPPGHPEWIMAYVQATARKSRRCQHRQPTFGLFAIVSCPPDGPSITYASLHESFSSGLAACLPASAALTRHL